MHCPTRSRAVYTSALGSELQASQRGRLHARASSPARSVAARAGSPDEIVSYARNEFARELQDEHFNLMRACMLVSLEEEAAICAYRSQAFDNVYLGDSEFARPLEIPPLTTDASTATWSARRLDALADDSLSTFAYALNLSHIVRVSRRVGCGLRPARAPGRSAPTPNPNPIPHATTRSDPRSPRAAPSARSTPFAAGAGGTLKSTYDDSDANPGLAPKLSAELTTALQRHPALFLHCVSQVLFRQHGYTRPERRGDAAAYLMSSVLEKGMGSPIALTILFREVCRRAGVELMIALLEGGSYCVVWPTAVGGEALPQHLSMQGRRIVLDAYTGGSPVLEDEVLDVFEVQELVPCSDRDLLFALLSGLQECHWTASLETRRRPGAASGVASVLLVALDPDVEVEDAYALGRALATAESCLRTKPAHVELYLYAAVLYYLSGDLEAASQHLDLVHECIAPWLDERRTAAAAEGGPVPQGRRVGRSATPSMLMAPPQWPPKRRPHGDPPAAVLRSAGADPDADAASSSGARALGFGAFLGAGVHAAAQEVQVLKRFCADAAASVATAQDRINDAGFDDGGASRTPVDSTAAFAADTLRRSSASDLAYGTDGLLERPTWPPPRAAGPAVAQDSDAAAQFALRHRGRASTSQAANRGAHTDGRAPGGTGGREGGWQWTEQQQHLAVAKRKRRPVLTLTTASPLPLNQSIFSEPLMDDMQVLRAKVKLLVRQLREEAWDA